MPTRESDEVEEFLRRFLPEARRMAAAAGRKWSVASWVDPADLESFAAERLIHAAQTWDPNGETSAHTWAYRHIRWAILDALRHVTRAPRYHLAYALDERLLGTTDDLETLGSSLPDPADPIGEATTALAARQLLAVLDAAEREEVMAYYWQERRLAELGAERDVTESRMSQRLTAHRSKMRRAAESAEAIAAAHLAPTPG